MRLARRRTMSAGSAKTTTISSAPGTRRTVVTPARTLPLRDLPRPPRPHPSCTHSARGIAGKEPARKTERCAAAAAAAAAPWRRAGMVPTSYNKNATRCCCCCSRAPRPASRLEREEGRGKSGSPCAHHCIVVHVSIATSPLLPSTPPPPPLTASGAGLTRPGALPGSTSRRLEGGGTAVMHQMDRRTRARFTREPKSCAPTLIRRNRLHPLGCPRALLPLPPSPGTAWHGMAWLRARAEALRGALGEAGGTVVRRVGSWAAGMAAVSRPPLACHWHGPSGRCFGFARCPAHAPSARPESKSARDGGGEGNRTRSAREQNAPAHVSTPIRPSKRVGERTSALPPHLPPP
ncbi:hypothetical protein BC628DRAFT_726127 [Trametes gibbosa]|nr:hypothetical protein BC628DRAFT_726127 [Trametes gibbosa]